MNWGLCDPGYKNHWGVPENALKHMMTDRERASVSTRLCVGHNEGFVGVQKENNRYFAKSIYDTENIQTMKGDGIWLG